MELTTARDFLFSLANHPVSEARVLSNLAAAGVDVIGLCAVNGGAVVHLAVEGKDALRARQALQSIDVSVADDRQVTVVRLDDRPGAGATLLQRLADAEVNLAFIYTGTKSRAIIGADGPGVVERALSS
jgi:hypothetical protein